MILRLSFVCLFVCITDRSKWKHADGPDRTSLDKMPKHDFKKPIACWPKPFSTNKVNNFTISLYFSRKCLSLNPNETHNFSYHPVDLNNIECSV